MSRRHDITFSIPEQFNMTSYFLEDNIAQERGKKIAIYYKDEKYTFNDVCTLTNKIGNVLKEMWVKPEERVLLVLQDSPEWVASYFAILKIGGVATWAYTYLQPGGYEDFVNLVRPRAIVVDETTLDRVREGARRTRYSPALLVAGEPPLTLEAGEYNLPQMIKSVSDYLDMEPTSKDDIALWNFSGGTTGKPKAVPHMHHDAVSCCESLQDIVHYTEDDVVLSIPKLFFHYARVDSLEAAFRVGAPIVLFPERTTAGLIFKLVEKYKATVLVNVPTMMRAMIQTPDTERGDLSSLRFCYSSGETLSPQLYKQWIETFGVPIVELVGSAEAYMAYLCNRPGEKVPGSAGKVAPLVEAKVVDNKGNEVPRGEIGVLWVQTDAAGQCYVRQHEKTKHTFLGNDWINTDDLFREDERGYFWYYGRADDMVKVSGVWVSPLEIETCLQTHPAVKECVVLGLADSDGLTKSKAFVALKAGFKPSEKMADELKAYCKEKLASYKSPKVIEFIGELPKTGYDKIDKRQLRERGL
jgi:benzoate-CoA ligase family protein